MKHLSLKRFFGIIVVLPFIGCATGPVMTGSTPAERPEWVEKFSPWRDAKDKENGDGRLYFNGFDMRKPKDVANDNRLSWRYDDAYIRADQAAKRSVSDQIYTKVESEYQEITKQKGGISKEDVEMVTKSVSSGVFQGWRREDMYTEEWQEVIKGKTVSSTYLWLLFSVPRESVENAQKSVRDELEELQKAKKAAVDEAQRQAVAREILERRMRDQETRFHTLSRKYDELRMFLSMNLFEDAAQLDTKFIELLSIYSDLLDLDLMESRSDKAGQDYKDLKRSIESTRDDYGYATRQSRMIDSLQKQIIAKDATIAELRRENESNRAQEINTILANNKGYTVQSQTIIISFPQKPQETEIPSLNILAAAEMVTNLDYISFTSINRINDFAKAEQGLDAPVTSVTWNNAARYCNWLSRLYRLTPCYDETQGQITGYDKGRSGYRLPEENEIQAMLQAGTGIINERDFSEYGIWSSNGFPKEFTAYKLNSGTGRAVDRLMKKSNNSASSDWRIGFRVVRNAK